MATNAVVLRLDSSRFTETLSALEELAQVAPELVDGLLGGSEALPKLGRVVRDPVVAPGARELTVVLEPTPFLLELVAALRALERERKVA
jgi:hypothetical protein